MEITSGCRAMLALALLAAGGGCITGDEGAEPGDPAAAIADTETMAGEVDRDAPGAAVFTDANVLGFLTMVDNAELEAAQTARDKATSAQVRQFAQMMAREHSRLVRRSSRLADSLDLGIDPPPTDELAAMHARAMSTLEALPRGPMFDHEYMRTQVRMHTRVLQQLQEAAGAERSAAVAEHLQRATGAVAAHLEQARSVQQAVGGA
jgi:putative membrane protein